MKMTARYWLAAAAGLTLAGTASAGLLQDTFESYTNLTPLINGTNQWYATDPSVVAQTNKARVGGLKAAQVTEYQTLSNRVNNASGKVWSDFYTLPRRYSADTTIGPAADPAATAQIYLTSNGQWAVIYKQSGIITTNVLTDVAVVPDDTNTWQHVSVLHDYATQKWSLFVAGVPVATNLSFIDTSATQYDWFNMQNRGGGSAYLDDITITNRVPLTLTLDSDGDGMGDAWEFMYYGYTGVTDNALADDDSDGIMNGNEARQRFNPLLGSDPSGIPFEADLPFYDGFENEALGGLYGKRGWDAALTSRVNIVSSPVFQGSQSVRIVAATASHQFYSPANSATSVWTHLVLKPVPMSEVQERLARTDTVAFYVDTNYVVNAYNSNAWVKLTNFLSTVGGTNEGAFVVDSNQWVRFVTKSDYYTRKWSLYAENVTSSTTGKYARLLASDLNFSTSGVGYASYQALVVENMLDPNTTSYLDSVEITLTKSPWVDTDGDQVPDYYEDAMGSSATNRDSDANTNGLSDRQEYVWGGTNMGRILGLGLTNNTSLAVKLTALVGADRTYEMVGSSDPDAPFATSVGTFYTGPNGESNTIVDPNGLARGNRFFYRLRSSSPGGALVMTNEETYVWYKQPQYALDSDYIVGVPVNYGTNNTLSGLLGADLARGLAAVGDEFDGGDTLHVLQSNGTFKDFWLLTGNPVTWRESGSGSLATQAIPPGAAVRIKRKLEPSQTANSILAGLQRTNNIGLPINVGWNLVGWPYDSTNSWAWGFTNAAAGGTPATRDQVFLVRNGIYIDVRPVSNNVWKVYGRPGAPTLLTDETYLQPGEALYYRRSGSSDTWTPVIP